MLHMSMGNVCHKKKVQMYYQLPILNDLGLHQPVTSLDLQTNGQYLETKDQQGCIYATLLSQKDATGYRSQKTVI